MMKSTAGIVGFMIAAGLMQARADVRPVEMKLLVIAATGSEPSLQAIQSYLDHLGTPYDLVLAAGQSLPVLDDGKTGHYQGIVLATGNAGVCDPTCRSALSTADWARLDTYTAAYNVRTLSYYTYPEARYGLSYRNGTMAPLNAPVPLQFTSDAGPIFPYLRTDQGVSVAGAFIYMGDPVAGPGETTIPILKLGDTTVGVLHTTADGREYLALTMDNAPQLGHSLLLNYGLVYWLTKGTFLGSRRIYLNPQVDDLFLADNLFTNAGDSCTPVQFVVSPTNPAPPGCPKLRISGSDLANIRAWQASWQARVQTSAFKLTFAFNGIGAPPNAGDDLLAEAQRSPADFFWISHTFSHLDLSCYATAPFCQPASYDQSNYEIQQNMQAALQSGIPYDPISVITPGISGLDDPNFLQAAADSGIRYLVTDLVRQPPSAPNTAVVSPTNAGILLVPRLATNIFFNAIMPPSGVNGSETDEYNYFFGPVGIVRVGGPGGPPFFNASQSYDQIVENESNSLLGLMLRYEPYPCMFHQSNLFSYQDGRSLLTDVVDRALQKFTALSTLPVISLTQQDIGALLESRMAWLGSGARATLYPGQSITITTVNGVSVPLTGVCAGTCEQYGNDMQSLVALDAGASVTISLQ
jgi:hypothetical protein